MCITICVHSIIIIMAALVHHVHVSHLSSVHNRIILILASLANLKLFYQDSLQRSPSFDYHYVLEKEDKRSI